MRSNDRSTSIWMVSFLAVAVAIGGGRLWRTRQPGSIVPIGERKMMTSLVLPQLDGGEWKLADHHGQVVLINYWATWCEPCREELPGLIELARDTDPRTVAIVGVALDSGPSVQATVRSFAKEFRVPYPITMPDAMTRSGLGEMGLPTTVLLDKHGRIARTYYGAVEREDFAKDIAALLAEG
jgi:cytochrome c biogenesis protein CcmG, thiol:disulfide interchange protein DsbE